MCILGLIGLEYNRKAVNAALKEEQQDTSLTRLTKDIKVLRGKIERQCEEIDELARLVEVMEGKPIICDDKTALPQR